MTDADRRQLTAVTPAQLTAYLAAHGWHQEIIAPSGAAVWHHAPAASVLVPDHTDYADYGARVWDVLHTVALVERRPGPEWSVLREMKETPVSADAEIQALLDGAPLPRVDVGEIEHRIQTAYGLHNCQDGALVGVAFNQACTDVIDLIACLRGYYTPIMPESEGTTS